LLLGVALFIAGFTVVFVAMGVLAGTLGRFFLQYGEVLTRVLGVVVIIMGLVFLGLFGFAQRTMKPQVRSGLGLVGAPLLGVAMGIGWAPCIGPTYAAILSISSPRPTRPARCCSPSRTRWDSASRSCCSRWASAGRPARWRSCVATSAPSTSSAACF
jgi:cytochrome c biogenesis protein CcdA